MTRDQLSLTYSIADQDFNQTKSLGILNLSQQLLERLSRRSEVSELKVLSNRSFALNLAESSRAVVRCYDRAIKGKLRRAWWDQFGVYRAVKKDRTDWLFLPKGFAPAVMRPPVKLAVYVHDTIHEFYQRHYPDAIPVLEKHYFNCSIYSTIKNASLIFTNSEFTRSELTRLAEHSGLRLPETRVAGIGFEDQSDGARSRSRENAILVLAGRWPHKRTDLAVRYLERWQQRSRFAGTIYWVGSVPSHVIVPRFDNWTWHGRLPEEEYQALMRRVRAVVYFSEYEGFGMPPVEAMLKGAMPVFSNIPATREAMGKAGFPFDNDSYESFRYALEEALNAPESIVNDWAQTALKRHDWERVADRVIEGLLTL